VTPDPCDRPVYPGSASASRPASAGSRLPTAPRRFGTPGAGTACRERQCRRDVSAARRVL